MRDLILIPVGALVAYLAMELMGVDDEVIQLLLSMIAGLMLAEIVDELEGKRK